jgi:hypothetical protein
LSSAFSSRTIDTRCAPIDKMGSITPKANAAKVVRLDQNVPVKP